MDYESAWKDIRALAAAVDLDARRQLWANRRGLPAAVEARAKARYDRLVNDSEGLRRMAKVSKAEAAKVLDGLIAEEKRNGELGAGANLRILKPKAGDLGQRLKAYVQTRRADVSLTFPSGPSGVLAGFSSRDMLALAQYRETVRGRIDSMSVGELEQVLIGAREEGAVGLVTMQLIEDRVRRGALSATDADLPVAKRVHERIEFEEDLRLADVENEIKQVQAVIAAASRAIGFAEVANIIPIDATHPAETAAAEAYQIEGEQFQIEQEIAAAE